ncbi:hypothetical protein G6F46_007888 [Rhizopus delemar]|uniref:Threonine/serine exporter-like N-terminal domain-containing protein n=2 Tax=Rhizopus TaxID=4842 RepID=A0A9P6YYT6_9FUNG|nr:hypothetical protein G6F43_009177 [Rhizopus delemar]KAG1540447.1 hypothetical protein G6F51_008522 [Rhizopus arrhizus]KAG1461137.1 hypothetical protein G6F55_003737 [Rhizopus delemar]KAG1494233.1 hypothetical protein G6F54_008019 [Rhizopus delemar]KAG1508707.1 hypothetical protein G6F53_007994 [Rhizopus delemar]
MDKLFKRKSSNKSIESTQNDTRVPEIALQSTETTAEKPALSRSSSTQSIIITPGKEEKAPVFDIQQEENLPSFQIEQEKEDVKEETDESNTNTLVEAAMDQAEAQDRHVRFQEHVAESAALVEHMLRMRTGQPVPAPDPLQTMVHNLQTYREEDDDELPQSPLTSSSGGIGSGGGSILASLMKLEAQRYGNNPNSKKKPTSLYNFPLHSSTDPLPDDNDHLQPTTKLKRPPLQNRPASWLSGVASSKYVVPSLEKRKKSNAPVLSRRTSMDSMVTTASQFEPITLEDRIRITFEIANILQKQEFLRKLCRALMMYGCPAHRLEYAMRQVSRTLGVEAEYVFIPNVMLMTFYDSTTHTTETHFIRQNPGFEMHRLADIYRLEKLVAYGEVSVDEALEFIDKVYEQPAIYPRWLQPFVFALAAFSGCVLFYGGRWKEGGVSAALGMLFAVNEIFSTVVSSLQPIWEITVCILIGFVARGVQKYEFCFAPIAFSSFIVVLPGYPMAVAIIELVSRQLVSGVVRMVYAIIYSFLLGYGVSMGSALYLTMDKSATTAQSDQCKTASNASTCISSESPWFNFLLVPLFGLAFCVYLRAKLPRWPVMVLVAAIAYVVNYSLSCWAKAPSQILQIAPAFTIALIGNLMSKFTGKMSFDAVLLGVFYLVPSGLGVKAALGLFGGGSDEVGNQGAGFALVMIETSIGITLGLFLATLLVYPKGTQRTPLMSL